ncbi:MAG: class II aldolase/adducin family protein [Faecalibacterium prausnitzii]
MSGEQRGLKPTRDAVPSDVYRLRPEINYIIHAHPTYSMLWTLQKKPLPLYTESAKLKLGEVPIVPDQAPEPRLTVSWRND